MASASQIRHVGPSNEVSCAYTTAMYFAQQIELNMKVLLFLGDQWGILPELRLTPKEKKHFKEDTSKFLDKATYGRLVIALVDAGLLREQGPTSRARDHRNELAHWFLAEIDFKNLTREAERAVLDRIEAMLPDLRAALIHSRLARRQIEEQSELHHVITQKMMTEFGLPELVGDPPQYIRGKKQKP